MHDVAKSRASSITQEIGLEARTKEKMVDDNVR